MFDLSLIQKNRRDACVLTYDTLASTNATARELAAKGARDLTVVLAEHQSAGRGRMSRSFYSPDGTGIYMSIVVRRPMTAQDATRLTTLSAVATAQAIESMIRRPVYIKWVNDIYLNGKKVCGILCEGAVEPGTSKMQYAVMGIGVNVTPPKDGFPEELCEIAGAVFEAGENANSLRDRLIGEILDRVVFLLEQKDGALCLAEYRRRAMVVGRNVTVHGADGTSRAARALDIDDQYRLIVQYEDGKTAALDGGEVSVRL